MMMNDDPFDRFCVFVTLMVVLMVSTVTLALQEVWIRVRHCCELSWLRIKYAWNILRLRANGAWTHLYYEHIRVRLELLDLVKPLTWADVEAYRLKLVAKSGYDIPRTPDLEEGLRREQEERERQHLQSPASGAS
jgi:hypothetical protein